MNARGKYLTPSERVDALENENEKLRAECQRLQDTVDGLPSLHLAILTGIVCGQLCHDASTERCVEIARDIEARMLRLKPETTPWISAQSASAGVVLPENGGAGEGTDPSGAE